MLTVGLGCVQSIGLVFLLTVGTRFGPCAYAGNSVWSFLLTVPPCPEIGLVFLCLWFPHRK